MNFRKWWRSEEPVEDSHNGGPLSDNGDWVVLPYRIAEAARLTVHTIGSHPEMPPHLQMWIAQWLNSYNTALSFFFRETYGEDIFPVLTEITRQVKVSSEEESTKNHEASLKEAFQRWEEQLGDDHG